MISAGTASIGVEPDLKGFGRDLARGIDPHIDKSSKHAESKLGGAFTKVAGIAGGLFAAKLGVDFGRDLLNLGTQVETLGKKAQTVFEGSTGDVTKWAKSNAAAFGVTDDTLRGLAAGFGDLLKPMGFTAKQAADMSTDVVGLSGALSAWSGGSRSAAEVSQILSSAMLGERDSLKGLGIAISEADVKARLLTKGQADLTGTALQQAEAVATQELIFEKSADAQKAWADGSMDAVKKQNALKEKIGELKEDLASKLQPAFAGGLSFLVDSFLPGVARVGTAIGSFIAPIVDKITLGFGAMKAAFSGEGITSDGFVGVMERVGVAVRAVVDWVSTNWPRIRTTIGEVFDWVMTNVVPRVEEVASFFIGKFGEMVAWVQTYWPAISEAIGHVVAVITEVIGGFIDGISLAWQVWGDEILNIATVVWDQIRNVIDTVVGIVRGIIETGLALINGDWGAAWDGIKGILSTAWDFIRETASNALKLLREAIEGGVSGIVAFVGEVPGKILGALGDMRSLLVGAGKAVMAGLKDGIVAGFEAVKNFVGGIAGKIADLKGPLDYDKRLLIPAGQAIMGGLIVGLKAEEARLVAELKRITGMIEGAFTGITGVANGVAKGAFGSAGAGGGTASGGGGTLGGLTRYGRDPGDVGGIIRDPNGNIVGVSDSSFGGADYVGPTYRPGAYANGGMVPGAPWQAQPIVAHGGEGILTADQMDLLRSGGDRIDYAKLAAATATALVKALAAQPQPVLKVDRRVLGEVVAEELRSRKLALR